VLIILVVVILQMTATSLHNRTLAENHLADLQNTYGAPRRLARAQLYLQADQEQNPEVDSLRETWATPLEFTLGKAHVRVQICDAERFINLSMLTNEKGEPNPEVVSQLKRAREEPEVHPGHRGPDHRLHRRGHRRASSRRGPRTTSCSTSRS
jgi:type II secretory pathway component PulK